MIKKNNLSSKEQKVKKRLKILANIIYKHNILYHQKDSPEINDIEYDKYNLENNRLEKEYPHLILKNSPNKFVGSPPSDKFKKISHKSTMLSLANAFKKEDIDDFLERLKKFLNLPLSTSLKCLCEPKIDGLSLNLYYKMERCVHKRMK